MAGNAYTGGCLCGNIRYRASGKPSNETHCHCETCRRASGAAFVSWATFQSAEFAFTRGKPVRFDSSEIAFRQFCPICGTQLTFQFHKSPQTIDFTLASLDDPAAITPVDHIWTKRQIPWIKLAEMLACHGIAYLHFPELSGRREPKPDSPNTAWREAGFRGYADYMETAEFNRGTARLLAAAQERQTAIMCAEKSWRVCHRGLIADHLKASGIEVIHILDAADTKPHPWSAAAQLIDGRLSYAAARIDQQQLPF